MQTYIKQIITEHIMQNQKLLNDIDCCQAIEAAYNAIIKCYSNKGKLLICGNGGSASDSAHFTAELMARFKENRIPLPAIDLTAPAVLHTAISNDYNFNQVYSRQVEALMTPDDILIVLSTSGNSVNIIEAVYQARRNNGYVISLLGGTGGRLKGKADVEIIIPSETTARIQESHILILHIICEMIDKCYKHFI